MAPKPSSLKIPWYLFFIFSFLSLGILLIGYVFYKNQVSHIKRDKQNALAAIMELKIQQVINWRQECLSDARVIAADRFLAQRINEFLASKGAPNLKKEIYNHLAAMKIRQFQRITLVGKRGEVELTWPPGTERCGAYIEKLISQVKQNKKIIFSDPYQDGTSREICLSLLVPILLTKPGEPVGVLLLNLDPRRFLYPLLQTWPTPSRTGETELLRREGREVVFLNELRHRPQSAMNLRFPVDPSALCCARAVRNVDRVIEGTDYRGNHVLAAGAPIPGSPWFLLAKMDTAEIFAPISTHMQLTVSVLLALVLSAGLGMAYVWRNQQAAFYRRHIIDLEQAEGALRESEDNLRRLTGQLLTAQETERQRISLVLHDELGQALILFKFQLSAIKDNLTKEGSVSANDCGDVLHFLDGLIDKVRQLSQDLNPPKILARQGFQAAVKDLIAEFSKFYHIQPSKVEIEEIKELLPREALISIYRIFQECLINIGRHAQAGQIAVEVKKQGERIAFTIEDNGRGFNPEQVMAPNLLKPGLGIPAMKERVRILGGSIHIGSKPGAGTRISFTIPLEKS